MDILKAIENNDITEVSKLLTSSLLINSAHSFYGYTPLLLACTKGNINIVKLLLEHPDIDVNYRVNGMKYPILLSIELDNMDIIKLLISHKSFNIKIYLFNIYLFSIIRDLGLHSQIWDIMYNIKSINKDI